MKINRIPQLIALSCVLATLAVGPAASADDADKAACASLQEGDACTRGDGDPGTCVPDDSDPVLTCEDGNVIFGAPDDSQGCNATGSTSPSSWLSLALLGMGVVVRRWRRR